MAEIPVRFHIELGSTLNALQPTSGQRAKKKPLPLDQRSEARAGGFKDGRSRGRTHGWRIESPLRPELDFFPRYRGL